MTLVRIVRDRLPVPDFEARLCGQRAIKTGRSWWALRYTDGRVVHEWDRDPGSPNGHADWTRLAYHGRQFLRLYCPNGRMAQVGATADCTGKLFQFKQAIRVTSPGGLEISNTVQAHVIGMVTGTNGDCIAYAWEPLPAPEMPTATDLNGLRPEQVAALLDRKATEQQAWIKSGGGRLVGPWDDNVWWFRYGNVGRLQADVLGLDDGEGR